MRRRRVLVVEDDFALRENLGELLIDEGYDVGLARNGLEALSQARRQRPDVIVLDLMMPVMTGWEFRRAQIQDPAIADVPVLVLSAVTREDAVDAAAFVPKPFELATLLGTIERLVQ